MPHTERPPGEPEVREHLVEEAKDFLHLMVSTLIEDGPKSGQYAYDQCHRPLAALEAGKAVVFSRSKLPPGHRLSAPDAGDPADNIAIDENDVVAEVEPKFVPPNRAQRRAAGWRGGTARR